MIGLLVKEEKPLLFFGSFAFLVGLTALVIFVPIFVECWQTGLVPRFPTLIVAVGASVVATLPLTCGLIVDTVARARMEGRRLAYLSASMVAPPLWTQADRGTQHPLPTGASHRAEQPRNG
jgi:hypothetical protein